MIFVMLLIMCYHTYYLLMIQMCSFPIEIQSYFWNSLMGNSFLCMIRYAQTDYLSIEKKKKVVYYLVTQASLGGDVLLKGALSYKIDACWLWLICICLIKICVLIFLNICLQ